MSESGAKIPKSSKVIGELHCNRWSDIANSLAFLIHFPVRFEVPMRSRSSKKLLERFSIISKLAVTTPILGVHYARENFSLSRESLNLNKLLCLKVDLKTTLSLQNGIFFSIVRLKRALKSSEDLPV